MKQAQAPLPPTNLRWEETGSVYQFAADYPGVMIALFGALLIVVWFFIKESKK